MPRSRLVARLALITALGLVAAPLTALPASGDHTATGVYVSEIHYDNDGTDTGEAIEVAAPPGTDLSGWTLVLYNGSGGAPYATTAVGPPNTAGIATVSYPANGIQNGAPDGVALVAGSTVVELLSYEGVFTAAGGPAHGMRSTDIGVSESASTPVGQSLQRDPRDHGSWYGPTASTFGAVNDGPPPPPPVATCDREPSHTVMQVQGSGAGTPLAGETVTVQGVVVADLQDGGYRGFHLQDATGDDDPSTSDGVFVFAPDAPQVALGDAVTVRGVAQERFGLTQVSASGADQVAVCGEGQVPAAATLGLPAGPEQLEALEGMKVEVVAEELTVTEVYNLNRFGEVMLSEGGRLVTPTEVAEPGDPARAVMVENESRRVVLDDGRSINLATAGIAPPYLELEDPVRVGDAVTHVEDVVLSFGFGLWRLQPVDGLGDSSTFAATNPRPAAPDEVGGDVRVASFNVLNYFVTFGGSARGADNEEELSRQEAKIVAAITTLGADVIALQEIENSSVTTPEDPYRALRTLVEAINEAEGGDVWGYVEISETSDVITNAIIYRTDRVETVGAPSRPTETDVWDNAREPLAQTFAPQDGRPGRNIGDHFTVIGNHFKSKGSGSGANADTGDGQGASNADRVLQAQALVEFAASVAESSGDDDVLLMGDFNAYRLEDPLDVIAGAGYTNLVPALTDDEYTYVFFGASGSLDHAFASPSVLDKVTGVDVWNINAVEAYAYQYNGFPGLYDDDPFRASDHDPIVLGLALDQRGEGRGTPGTPPRPVPDR